jgi:hypothetical protein
MPGAEARRNQFRARMAEIDRKFPPPPMATVWMAAMTGLVAFSQADIRLSRLGS